MNRGLPGKLSDKRHFVKSSYDTAAESYTRNEGLRFLMAKRICVILVSLLIIFSALMYGRWKTAGRFRLGVGTQEQTNRNANTSDAIWVEPFLKSINHNLAVTGMTPLKTVELAPDDLELRFWFEALPEELDGVVITRNGEHWSATRLHKLRSFEHRESAEAILTPLPEPISGWNALWQTLQNEGVLTLPNGSSVDCHKVVPDGYDVIVETNLNGSYRTFAYAHPDVQECKEGKQVYDIQKTLESEFGLN